MSNLKRHCCLRPEQHDGKRGHSCDNKSIQYPLTFDSYKYYYQFNHVTSSFPDKIYIWLKYSPFLPVRCLRQFSLSETLFYCCCLMMVFQNAFIEKKLNTKCKREYEMQTENMKHFKELQSASLTSLIVIAITCLIM